jgi:hypothetical protein
MIVGFPVAYKRPEFPHNRDEGQKDNLMLPDVAEKSIFGVYGRKVELAVELAVKLVV